MTIVPPYIAPVDPFLGLGGAFPKTVLFAYQEGEQMHEFVERLRKYVVELSPYIDGSTAKLIEAFVNEVNRTITNTNTAMVGFAAANAAAMGDLVTEFNTIVQEIVNTGITVSDPVMTGVATNVETEFRQLLNGLYSSKATQVAVETGRLAKTALDADYASKSVQSVIETGRLSPDTLASKYTSRRFVPLHIWGTESNSGGQALNTQLSAAEKLPRPAVQIFNSTTMKFETLQIGVNNNIGHAGLVSALQHGWEAGLADSAEGGEWEDQVYLVKFGQGGSKLSEWETVGTYFQAFMARTTAAIAEIRAKGYEPQIYVWLSSGINDHLASVAVATFGGQLMSLITRIRGHLGMVPVAVTRLPVPYHAYNAAIDQVPDFLPLVWPIYTQTADKDDVSHWGSNGMKVLARSFIDRFIRTVGQASGYQLARSRSGFGSKTIGMPVNTMKPAKWVSNSAGTAYDLDGSFFTSGKSQSALAATLDLTKPFLAEVALNVSGGDTVAVYLDAVAAMPTNWDILVFNTGVYRAGNGVYVTRGGTSAVADVQIVSGAVADAHIRIYNSAGDVRYAYSADSGRTWADVYTHAGMIAGVTTGYLKAVSAAAGSKGVKVALNEAIN